MNMNYVINMVMRMIMRKAISGGINAGISAASGLGKKRKKPQYVDDYGHVDETLPRTMPGQGPAMSQDSPPKLTQQQRDAKRAMRQARRSAKAAQRATRM